MPPLKLSATDPVALTQALVRCPSVTPADAGALDVVEGALTALGFVCQRLKFADIDNLYARLGVARPNFCFAGHTDVVPPGDHALWKHHPFEGTIEKGTLYGRGAADMKGGIAAFIAAVARKLASGWVPKGSISLLITGDEEGLSINGTVKVLEWTKTKGEIIDHCLVGEPTSAAQLGDMIKIGRRGSITAEVRVKGTQGHVGYPHRALNPIPALAEFIRRLPHRLDEGTDHFEASTLSFTTVDVGNPANNVIPAEARATLNVRFNDTHTPDSLKRMLQTAADAVSAEMKNEIALAYHVSGDAFLTKPGAFTELLSAAVTEITGRTPELSTTGGTSDSRFIKEYCPVADMGLVGASMHKTDECVPVAELESLTRIYETVLARYFAGS